MNVAIERNGQVAEGRIVATKNTLDLGITLYILDNDVGLEWTRASDTWKLFPNWKEVRNGIPVNVKHIII